ncbi:MAG TPA: YlxM family DNA-binding protein [Thermoanaerobacterales bacterium]|nr:YlxM family DNA-binding protein [Thermoanaerobacterales bacterium]
MGQKADYEGKGKIEIFIEINLLYDFYGKLLTNRQSEFIELYYNHDLSLGEIAEQYDISRQGVYDTIKRAENSLRKYEDKLKLIKRFEVKNSKLQQIYDRLTFLEKRIYGNEDFDLTYEINNIKKHISELI